MSDIIEVPPFLATVEENVVTFRFDHDALEQGFEYPPNMEVLIANVVGTERERFGNREIRIDLENLPAISSKQLGAMLAVRKTCGGAEKVHIVNLRPNVRELLMITKLSDFFDWDDG